MAWTGDSDLNLNFKGGSMRFPHIFHMPFFCYYCSPIQFGAKIQSKLKMILSKWEIPFADDSFEYVDITNQLVKFFNPDDATKKIIDEIKAMEPIPIEKIPINPMD
jgi:hypothetical protein